MIRKILIANRGEIAIRIIRACREMGIETVAVYSEADREALHTQLADEAVCIGTCCSKRQLSEYRSRLFSATMITGADAIHPDLVFYQKTASLRNCVRPATLLFIGPDSDIIARLGNKAVARQTMVDAGVPVIPGCQKALTECKRSVGNCKRIGFPVIVKAVLGGGGKGMRVAYNEDEFENAFLMAQKESGLAFGDESMYLEHFVENPRHIEFQILADNYGNVIHLGERDCSVQRNHQKVIEESPSAVVDEELREKMGQAAVLAAKAAGYKNAGTIEFLLEKDKSFYFMEMNTRIQVEHPVTEWVTGIDLIKAQIRIADGEKLKWKQEDIQITGHAIECRINAEDPSKNFRPCPGRITDMYLPGGKGVRIDSAIYSGCEVSPYYDSMITKLIVFAATRKRSNCKKCIVH